MKNILLIAMMAMVAIGVSAQPKKRRAETNTTTQQNRQQGISRRAQLMFPTAIDMPEDVVWRRDIYREIDLNKDANAGLYYPVEVIDKQMNLFTYIFKLALNGYIPVYEYRLDGNEVFSDSARASMQTILDNYHIFYEEQNGKLRVDNSDIPSSEVKMYYLKESAYFNQANSTFHRKVLALCPIMVRDDDFGGESAKYPLFWVKYSDLAPFLSRQSVMTSNLNNAAVMSLEDYFTMNKYKGDIYKTNNMLGKTLAQYCPTDSALAQEQKKIEAELAAFEKNIFGDPVKKDSLDSIANLDPKAVKATKQKAASSSGRRSASSGAVKTKKPKSSASSSSSSGARMTVRRQRH
ncbi:MAG: gliding motility protein GldN [Prevotella sp.]|nr:gliding motility protein GldN [Prevotella sp.]